MKSRFAGLFGSADIDKLHAKERESKSAEDAYKLCRAYLKVNSREALIAAFAWLAMAIVRGSSSAKKLFFEGKLVLSSELSERTPRQTDALSTCVFITALLFDVKFPDLLNSNWIAHWKADMGQRFLNGKLDEIVAEVKKQTDIFNPFFDYCFDNNILDSSCASKLGVEYAPSRSEGDGEATSLLGSTKVGRY